MQELDKKSQLLKKRLNKLSSTFKQTREDEKKKKFQKAYELAKQYMVTDQTLEVLVEKSKVRKIPKEYIDMALKVVDIEINRNAVIKNIQNISYKTAREFIEAFNDSKAQVEARAEKEVEKEIDIAAHKLDEIESQVEKIEKSEDNNPDLEYQLEKIQLDIEELEAQNLKLRQELTLLVKQKQGEQKIVDLKNENHDLKEKIAEIKNEKTEKNKDVKSYSELLKDVQQITKYSQKELEKLHQEQKITYDKNNAQNHKVEE